jgi:hypothetical protein
MQRLNVHLEIPDGITALVDKRAYIKRLKQRLADLAEALHIFSSTGESTGQPSISGMFTRAGVAGQAMSWDELQNAIILRLSDKADMIDPVLLAFLHTLDKGELVLIVPALPPAQRKPRVARRVTKNLATTARKGRKTNATKQKTTRATTK